MELTIDYTSTLDHLWASCFKDHCRTGRALIRRLEDMQGPLITIAVHHGSNWLVRADNH